MGLKEPLGYIEWLLLELLRGDLIGMPAGGPAAFGIFGSGPSPMNLIGVF